MVIPKLRERLKKLQHDLAKSNRDKATADQQISMSA